MKRPNAIQLIPNLALAAALAALAGCASSDNYTTGSKAGTGLTECANRINAGAGKIDTTLTALSDIVNNPQSDLVAKFKIYSTSVNDLESTAANVRDNVAAMRKNGKTYFDDWNNQLAQIKNEDIKKSSDARRLEVQKQFSDIKKSYIETADQFKPFMSDLKDIQTALGTDLTPGGVTNVKGAAAKANTDGTMVKTNLTALADKFRTLGVAMSAAAPPQPDAGK